MISSDVNIRIATFVRQNILQTGNTLVVYNNLGEVARKVPTNVQYVSSSLTQYTYYLNEEEAKNTTITTIQMLDTTGSEVATQTLNRAKGYPESLLITWTLEVTN
jgi:hypothetical protein